MSKKGYIISSILLVILGICFMHMSSAEDKGINEKKIKAIIFDIGNVFVEVDLNMWKKTLSFS